MDERIYTHWRRLEAVCFRGPPAGGWAPTVASHSRELNGTLLQWSRSGPWRLFTFRTFTASGRRKRHGGDSWRIVFRQPRTGARLGTCLGPGRRELRGGLPPGGAGPIRGGGGAGLHKVPRAPSQGDGISSQSGASWARPWSSAASTLLLQMWSRRRWRWGRALPPPAAAAALPPAPRQAWRQCDAPTSICGTTGATWPCCCRLRRAGTSSRTRAASSMHVRQETCCASTNPKP